MTDTGEVRLAEVVGALSLATDVGMGAPLELGLGTSLVATPLAQVLGCTPTSSGALTGSRCCATSAAPPARTSSPPWSATRSRSARGMGDIDFSDRRALLGYVVRSLGGDSPIGRVRALARFAASAGAMKEGSLAGCEVASRLADVAGDFADLKSPYTIGHSRGVADLARAAGAAAGLGDDEQRRPLLAGLVHDLGRVGVSSAVWGKEAPLSRTEWEQVRLHPYTAARVLDRAASLREVAGVAAGHHERLDGSGYHRGVPASAIGRPARLLAAADAFHAMTEPRPHRPALERPQAAGQVRREARDGRLDADAVEAVLAAAGEPARRRRTHAAGLTPREVEVLRLLARGLSIKAIAAELTVAPKTVDAHIQHIYAKAGVSTRAAATLFAAEHDLLETV